jgi:hypothetical protein
MTVVIQTPGGKPMPRVAIEDAQKILRLSNQGLSYSAIGKRLGYNNKTVSLWVKKAKESEKTRVMEVTGTDLNTRYTGEHHKMLLAAARGVYKAVSTPLPSVREGQEAKVLLEHQVLTGLQDLKDLLADRGVHVRPGEPGGTGDRDPELLETMAARLREGLFQHLPDLGEAVETWSSSRDELRVRQSEVVEQVTAVLVQRRQLEEGAAREIASRALELVLSGRMSDLTDVESSDENLAFAVGQVEPRMDRVREPIGRVTSSADDCKALVADLLLWGGASGKCDACAASGKPI